MKNLFVCHTQAQLILASGLTEGRFKNDTNILIIFIDFELRNDLKNRLIKIFDEVLFLQSIYPSTYNTIFAKIKWYPQDWNQIKAFLQPIDRLFISCDWILLEQKILKRAYKLNHNTEMLWLEDGISAYYKDVNIKNGFDKNVVLFFLRKVICKYLLGVGRFYNRDFQDSGGLKCLNEIYCCYPDIVREPYKSQRKKNRITNNEYIKGLISMFEINTYNIREKSIIFVIDKLDRYIYPDKVYNLLEVLINYYISIGRTIICKFHPRETEMWDIFKRCQILEKSMAIESTYLSLLNYKENILVAGIKSTGLMTAKKLGYYTVSLFNFCGEQNNNLLVFYRNLGIKLPQNIDDLLVY